MSTGYDGHVLHCYEYVNKASYFYIGVQVSAMILPVEFQHSNSITCFWNCIDIYDLKKGKHRSQDMLQLRIRVAIIILKWSQL
jgi:hypothetical protein